MLRLMIVVCMMILRTNISYAETNSNEVLEYRYENFRAYASVLNRFSLQGFTPFDKESYFGDSVLIVEGHQKWWWKSNVYFMLQVRFSFLLNTPYLPIEDSLGVFLGVSGDVYNNISLLSSGKGISVLMYGGAYFSSGDFKFAGNGVLGPEIGIRINNQFHKNVALTFGLDIGYHYYTYRTPTEESYNTFANEHGFMIGASIGFTFNWNYI